MKRNNILWRSISGVLVILCFIFAAYHFDWSVTGFLFLHKTLWDWMQILIVPVVLGFIAYLFNQALTHNNQKIAEERYERDQEIAEERYQFDKRLTLEQQKEVALQTYLDRMSELLLTHHLRASNSEDEVRYIARARTLTVLSQLDADRKKSVLQFLHESELISTNKKIISLIDTDLSKIDLRMTNLSETDLSGANLSGANLSETDLSGANLSRANLSETCLIGANLSKANLIESDLSGVDLSEANLRDVNLSRASLNTTILYPNNGKSCNANLSGANLSGANLSDVDLSGVDLSHADLSHADLSRANLKDANLSKAKMQKVKGLTQSELETYEIKGAIM